MAKSTLSFCRFLKIVYTERYEKLKKKYEELLDDYERLQNIYVETEDEMTGYRDSFLNESIRHDREMQEIKARISTLDI